MNATKYGGGGKKYWAHHSAEVSDEAHVGTDTNIWHNTQILSGARVGDGCTIGHNCLISGMARLGNGVKLESNIDVWDMVMLEDNVFVGPSAVFTNDATPRAAFPKKQFPKLGSWQKTLVREGATIGANATILCGITIGTCALIGAGAVVTKNIPDYALVVGVPATRIGWVCTCGNTLKFQRKAATCAYCSRRYKKEKGAISPI
jgi:UDP-2-acetamido-3-amino-2,3-dideoxy-glucuronate N-acetyltransferase